MPNPVNLEKPTGGFTGFAFEELDDERQARIARENAEHAHRIWKDKIVFGLVIGAATILFLICGYVLMVGGSADTRELAKIGITALFTGLVSFLAGHQMR